MFWLTSTMILERMVVNTTPTTYVPMSNATSKNSMCVSLFGIASSSAFLENIGVNSPMMPPTALMVKAITIHFTYFLI